MNMQIGVSDGDDDDDDDEDESPSQRTETADDEDDEEDDQELANVDSTTTTIENLQTKERGIKLLKLMWGEFVVTLCHIGRSRMRTMKGHHEY